MQPKLQNYQENSGAELLFPSCGSINLQHKRVEVFERTEDAKSGLHVVVSDGKVMTDTELIGNPSERRHGLLIHFSCEQCSAQPVLSIVQHKGTTCINIR